MSGKIVKTPSPEHPISLAQNQKRIVVTVGGKEIANTVEAITLREAAYPAVQYIPRKDVEMAALERSATRSYCPYKGDAAYFSIAAGGARSVDAVWTYEAPYAAVAAIEGHLAFYPDRVDAIEERDS